MSPKGDDAEVSIAKEDFERYKAIFDKLDTNKDGHIQSEELEAELRSKNVPDEQIATQAQVKIK